MPATFYDQLGLAPTAEPSAIDSAFRTACAISGGSDRVAPTVRLAYRVLGIPEKRAAYDQMLQAAAGETLDTSVASMLKVCADDWGFKWEDAPTGTVFRHVGVGQTEAPATPQPVHPEPKLSIKLDDVMESPKPVPRWKAAPVVLGEKVFHLRPFSYRVVEAVFATSHVELHLDNGDQSVLRFPELVSHRGIRPGCQILMCGMGNLAERDWFYFTGACIYPYAGGNGPEVAALAGLVNHWFDHARRTLRTDQHRKRIDRNHFCMQNFGVRARSKRDYERVIVEYELRTWEALLRFADDWLGRTQSDKGPVSLAQQFATETLKDRWGIRKPPL